MKSKSCSKSSVDSDGKVCFLYFESKVTSFDAEVHPNHKLIFSHIPSNADHISLVCYGFEMEVVKTKTICEARQC